MNSDDDMKHMKHDNDDTDVASKDDSKEGREDAITGMTKTIWRQCLQDVQTLYIPHAMSIRPMKTENVFVTKAIVLLAYLIVHAKQGKPMPKISGKFKIDPLRHRIHDMEEEILRSGIDYINNKLKWNTYTSPEIHIGACLSIGSWLANQLHKARHHGTWKVVDGHALGSPRGLYEPYRDLLQKIGINVPCY